MPPPDRSTTLLTVWTRPAFLWPVLVVTASIAILGWYRSRPVPEELARQARKAFGQGEVSSADQLLQQALSLAPASAEVLVAAGEIAARSGDSARAIEYYDRAPADGTIHAIVAAGAAGDLLLKAFRLSEAERRFRRILEIDPQHVLANRRLAAILVMAGRRRESARYLFELARLGECDADELALLGNLEQVFDNDELLDRFVNADPHDPAPRLGKARLVVQGREIARGIELLAALIIEAPELWEARVSLGKLLAGAGSREEFLDWHSRLPAELDQNPDVWSIRGRFAEQQGEADVAIRCYWEALRRDPDLGQANYQLGVLLSARKDERAPAFVERARRIKALVDILKVILADGITADLALQAARSTEALGRLWEAWNWYRFAISLDPDAADAARNQALLERQITAGSPLVVASANPTLQVDFSSFPLPAWKSPAGGRDGTVGASRRIGAVRFADLAEAAGVHFTYENGDEHDIPGMRIFQSVGGGVAVLDYDGDGWADLHFTQGGQFPPPAGARQPEDRLFRNLGNGTFTDVTAAAGVGDTDYGQGVAAGDYDNDGFPDLYVANIGRNRLYHNHGDGTFSDVTGASGMTATGWTASCLIADLNGDGLPEIYDVTYLAGKRPLELRCEESDLKEYRGCKPNLFDAEEDRLYVNRGDGTFADVSASAGIRAPDGKGLGGVAADFELTGRLNLFVANDTVANFYYVNETPSPGAPVQFSERAYVAGCACDAAGRSHANMGIAVADADGDGLLDMFVTAFRKEYAVFYLQKPAGMFVDQSRKAGLEESTAMTLGFGTQFIDADLDGWPDLVIANGHVDDYRMRGIDFRMRPQFFANLGNGRFTELPARELGDYFQRELLGRALARLDWNRDGREDFAVAHVDTPVALVTNQSPGTGHFLALQFRGVESSRDAVGAVVRVTAAGRTRMQQITAGDGYHCSNQKQLIFGLGEATHIEGLEVRWPSGLEQRFEPMPVDREYVIVEGRSQIVPLPNQ